MSDSWEEELKRMKEEAEKKREEEAVREIELRERYKDQRQEVLDVLNSQLQTAVEIFKDPKVEDRDQPRATSSKHGASLHFPIVCPSYHVDLAIHFSLDLYDDGYGLKVESEFYSTDEVWTNGIWTR